jgi:hypothetical protein
MNTSIRKTSSWTFATFSALILLGTPSHAARFANQFTEFELPPGWQCNLEGAEWVCQNQEESKKREAMIVLAAKLKGDQDSLDQYLTYLKATKSFTTPQGRTMKSEPKYAKSVVLNGHSWVDALHLESEIPGFYTRYLATVKEDIGVLITYSINQAKYQEYLTAFDTMIATLKVFRKTGGINAAPAQGNLFDQAKVPTQMTENQVFPSGNIEGGAEETKPKSRRKDDTTFYLLAAAGAVALFLFLKRKRG